METFSTWIAAGCAEDVQAEVGCAPTEVDTEEGEEEPEDRLGDDVVTEEEEDEGVDEDELTPIDEVDVGGKTSTRWLSRSHTYRLPTLSNVMPAGPATGETVVKVSSRVPAGETFSTRLFSLSVMYTLPERVQCHVHQPGQSTIEDDGGAVSEAFNDLLDLAIGDVHAALRVKGDC